METFEISVTIRQLVLLNNAEADVEGLLKTVFLPASKNYQLLTFELRREFRHGGSPDVMNIRFDRARFDNKSGSGSFRIVLDATFTFGCEDSITEKKDQTSEWTFTVDRSSRTITFYSSPFAEDRSTADEF